MPLHSAVTRVTLAALFIIATFCTAGAQAPTPTVADFTKIVEGHCKTWSAATKKAADMTAAQRTAAIDKANLDLEGTIKLVEFPKALSDADVSTVVSKLRTCLEKAAKDAFGPGTTATISFNPRINNAKQSRTMDTTIQVIPGAGVVTLAANQSLGKQWGDICLSRGSAPCCKESATRECKSVDICKVGVKMCETMVGCNQSLNECKKREMATDKSCDGAKCKACTSNYKTCHDAAVKISF